MNIIRHIRNSKKYLYIIEIFKYLFSFTDRKDVSNLPKKNKLILGITSLWMILPLTHGIFKWIEYEIGVGQKSLIIILSCTCFSSLIFLFDARSGILFHKLDKICAINYVICMIITSTFSDNNNILSIDICLFLLLSLIILFLLGDMCFKINKYDYQLIFHILFRYIGYWWGHLLLVLEEKNFASAIAILSVGYFGHIIVFNEFIRRRHLIITKNMYWKSCAILGLWIIICGKVHLLVCYSINFNYYTKFIMIKN
jgi:hypothetical protein